MNTHTKPPSSSRVEGHESPCMKTLTVKILARCWEREYEESRRAIDSALTGSYVLDSHELSRFTHAVARRNVSTAVMILVANKPKCGDDLFIPFLSLRCQKELARLEKSLSSSKGTEQDYCEAAMAAWSNILRSISRP